MQFSRGSSNEPKCSGIEVFPSTASPAPQITGLALAGGVAVLSWQTAAATLYQAQFKNSLLETNWSSFGNTVLGSGDVVSLTNNISGVSNRFYRIAVVN